MSELTVIEIKPDQAPVLYVPNGLDAYLEQIRQLSQEVPDVTTKKGRDRIGSLARAVGSSKKAIEDPGRAYLKHLKEAVKPAEEELRRFTRECDLIRDTILKPRDEWEAEQERIRVEEAWNTMHEEALVMNKIFDDQRAAKIESDHEMALLMNDAFDREAKAKAEEADRQRIVHEEELTRQAAEKAKREAEEKIERERVESARREAELKLKAEQAERDRIASDQKAAAEKVAAAEQAEREKQEAIAAEQRKAQEKEAARLAEEKRIADEKAKREADVKHRKAIGTDIVNALTANTSISREQAIEVLTAMMNGLVPHSNINY